MTEPRLIADPLGERFWSKVNIVPGGCWEWTGARNSYGYGTWAAGRRLYGTNYVHRLVWLAYMGPIPVGNEIDHTCFNPPCVNLTHLRDLTKLENIRARRDWLRHKSECPQGHPYSPENTYVATRPDGREYLRCRACGREASARWAEKNPRPAEYFRAYRAAKKAARRAS